MSSYGERLRSLYEQQWLGPNEYERKLLAAADEYHQRCETYDQLLVANRAEMFGLSIYDAAKMLMPHELRRSNRNALQVKADLMRQYGLTSDEFKQALKLSGP